MNAETSFLFRRSTLSKRALLFVALMYLLLPNLLFLFGWFKLYISFPLSVLLLLGACVICKASCQESSPSSSFSYTCKDVLYFAATCVFAWLFVDLVGFTGHVNQSCDFAVRNPIYHTLVRDAWPIFSERGEYFIYYHSLWLPPAFISKLIHGWVNPDGVLALWVYVGIVIFAALLYARLRGRVLCLFIILCMLGNISELPNIAYRMMTFNGHMNPEHAPYVHFLQYLGFGTKVRYFHFWGNVVYGFNSAVPILVCMGVFLSKALPIRYFPYAAALIVATSPFCAVALVPLMVLLPLADKRVFLHMLKDWKLWICVPLLVVCALFFMGQKGSEVRFIWSESESLKRLPDAFSLLSVRLFRYAYVVLGMLIPLFLLIRRQLRRNIWFKFIICLVFFLPLLWIGRHNNEFLFKGSMCLFVVYAWLLTEEWKYASILKRKVMVVFLLLSCLHLVTDAKVRHWGDYGWSEEKIARHKDTSWNDTMNHPEKYEYKQFWGKVLCPTLQYDSPGASPIK